MKILIAGDFSLSNDAEKHLGNKDNLSDSFSDITPIISQADYSFVNLESPVTSSSQPITKDGPSLRNSIKAIEVLKALGFNAVTLANNHLNDYGSRGVFDTLRYCTDYGLKSVGAGNTETEAREPLVIGDKCPIGILNVCEHEFSIATNEIPGCAPLDLINLYYDIKDLQTKVCHIIVIVHGGSEHYRYPTPRMQKTYRYFIDLGADVVINHHQHCFSGYERYNNGYIVYGLGNFYFQRRNKSNMPWNYGYMVEFDFSNDIKLKLYPYQQCNNDFKIKNADTQTFLHEISDINKVIADAKLLAGKYSEFVSASAALSAFFPINNHYIRGLYNHGYISSLLSKKQKINILNSVRCESHRDIVIEYLESLSK